MEAEPKTPVFERIEVQENSLGIPAELKERFAEYPVLASGQWEEDQLMFHLRWEGGYTSHLDPVTRADVSEEYRNRWQKAIAPKVELLNSIKELPMDERKRARRNIRPFHGVLMTFEGMEIENRVVVKTRVGNYAQIHPDFGICTPSFIDRLKDDYPDLEQNDLWRVARGMGVQIITETADKYHIFGQRAAAVMGAGFIGSLGITPQITDKEMRQFIHDAGSAKSLEIPSSWLFDGIRADISEHDELNLESRGLQKSGFESLNFIGAIPDPKSGWMTLLIYCKLHVTTSEIESLWSGAPDHEYNNLIFVKNNPASLIGLLSRPNIYPAQYGGYHAYFRLRHPELL